MAASADLGTAPVIGDKVVRAIGAAFLTRGQVTVQLAATDDAMELPVWTVVKITGLNPTRMTCTILVPTPAGTAEAGHPTNAVTAVTKAVTSMTSVTSGLATFRDSFKK